MDFIGSAIDAIHQDTSGIATNAINEGIQTAYGYYSQKHLNEQAQANTQKNLHLSQELADKSYFDRIKGLPAAMRAAGINPASASAQSFTAASPTGSSGTAGAPALPHYDAAPIQMVGLAKAKLKEELDNLKASTKSLDTQADKNEAEKDKAEAEAENTRASTVNQERENIRKDAFDSSINEQMREYYKYRAEHASSEAEKEQFDVLANSANEYNKGTLDSQILFTSFLNQLSESERDMTLNALVKKVAEHQSDNEDVLGALIYRPYYEQIKLIGETADAWSSAQWKRFQKEALGPQQVNLMQEEEVFKKHQDVVGMVKDGDYKGAAVAMAPVFISALGGIAHDIILYRTFKGAPSLPVPELPKLSAPKSSASKGIPSSTYTDMVRNAGQQAKGDKVKFAQILDKLVRDWHKKND